ncbi:TPR repeat-containing protein [Fimbriimonas ginsengisoli Gsoil 348]|uniref:TPR repeat-containing protein n=1 Tax=Fimbriimonas ginsengisoli Gsoil 348 TaxID=661478 RepID=A0A068NW21_FIMGI|nr:TPR repeat-containing protein [Fimbriimonas ginsengisoli Gsoil 348]
MLREAGAAHAKGDLKRATALAQQALEMDEQSIQAKLLLGVIEAKVGDPTAAVGWLRQVREADPGSFHAPFWQSVALHRLGFVAEAAESVQAALLLNPNDAQALAQLGRCLMDLRRLPEAEELLRRSVHLSGGAPPVQFQLSLCLHLQGRDEEAERLLAQVLGAMPPSAQNFEHLASYLMTQGNALGAVACARRALEVAPNSPSTQLLLGRILQEENRAAEAEQLLRKAAESGSKDAPTMARLGTALQGLGRLDEAIGCFQNAIAVDPSQGYPYFALVNGKRVVDEDRSLLERMTALADDARLTPRDHSFLRYGLGKAHGDLGDYQASMENYRIANDIEADLRFHGRLFDFAEYTDRVDRTIHRFTAPELARMKTAGSASDVPIFVVGMMRSGTTLVEQILSSHPEVGAGGEQPFWVNNWPLAVDGAKHSPEGMSKLADRYLAILTRLAPGNRHVVDKMPVNYAGLGIIHSVFPRAKIVHIRRHPVDNCLSIYFTPNRVMTEFAHVPENIVFAYREYLRVMDHWRSVLPPEALLEIDYSDLVSDAEQVIRKTIDFLGLPWDDACLSPHQNQRSVVTPSVWQVRQPIYRSSLETWKKYEPWLGPFGELLPKTSEMKC